MWCVLTFTAMDSLIQLGPLVKIIEISQTGPCNFTLGVMQKSIKGQYCNIYIFNSPRSYLNVSPRSQTVSVTILFCPFTSVYCCEIYLMIPQHAWGMLSCIQLQNVPHLSGPKDIFCPFLPAGGISILCFHYLFIYVLSFYYYCLS